MIISLLIFIFIQKKLGIIGFFLIRYLLVKKKILYELFVYVGVFVVILVIIVMVFNMMYMDYFMYIIGLFSFVYFIFEMMRNNVGENKKLLVVFLFIVFFVFFWVIFEQVGGFFVFFVKENVGDFLLFFYVDFNIVNNLVNLFFVIGFVLLVGIFFIVLVRKKLEFNLLVKFGLGFLFLGLVFYIFYFMVFIVGQDGKGLLNIFIFGYLVVSFGELFFFLIGMSFMIKLVLKCMLGFMMGMWFLVFVYGQYVVGLFGVSIFLDVKVILVERMIIYIDGYFLFVYYVVIVGVILIVILFLMCKFMGFIK